MIVLKGVSLVQLNRSAACGFVYKSPMLCPLFWLNKFSWKRMLRGKL
jgi:hypothetical protein